MQAEDKDRLIPGEDDDNVGGEPPKKKKEKKRKSKEERTADRKVVFWILIIMLVVTGVFYFYPILRENKLGEVFSGNGKQNTENGESGWKGYTEVKF